MSRKTVENCMCDICGKEGAKSYRAIAYRTFGSTDITIRYEKPKFENISIDLCDECASKVTALHSIGVYGEKYEIKPIGNKNEP